MYSVLGRADQGITLDWLAGQRHVLEEQRTALQAEVEEAERQVFLNPADDDLTLAAQEDAYRLVQSLQSRLGKAREERDAVALNIADSAALIAGLRAKIIALNDASAVSEHIGQIDFHSCPACYATLDTEDGASKFACRLCKTQFDFLNDRVDELLPS